MFTVGRFIAGFGGAGISTGTITIISLCAPLEKLPSLIGSTMGFNLLGLVLGLLSGGAFTSYTIWRWCLYVNVPVGVLAVLAILPLRIPEQTTKQKPQTLLRNLHKQLDIILFILFAPAVLQILLALQFGGQTYPWNSPEVIGLLCGTAATTVVWGFWNRYRGDEAMMPRSMLRQKNVLYSGIYKALATSAAFGGIYYLPIYFQAVHVASVMMSAVYILPMIVSQLFASAFSVPAIQKIGFIIPIALVSTAFLSTGTRLYSLIQPDTSRAKWIGFQILGAFGFGAGLQLPVIAVQAAIKGEELSSGIAMQSQIPRYIPKANTTPILNAGATGFRTFIAPEDMPGVLKAYANSIDRVFYLASALATASGVFL
ncbi:MFS general substrate transporter [Periconia macrospinosa]|uniref:MFS general substrate transporter n=1 Tax=Periconia macrospinosa TaxID=97972 RepID=A0A2V1D3X1_9PLEO|nr:MFS general substrate transporter [Periconia macrospinosa]